MLQVYINTQRHIHTQNHRHERLKQNKTKPKTTFSNSIKSFLILYLLIDK